MQTIEQINGLERAAYITNDPQAALLARIADLERKCAVYECALDAIADGGREGTMTAKQCAAAAYEVL
jgi:hypothetical protein